MTAMVGAVVISIMVSKGITAFGAIMDFVATMDTRGIGFAPATVGNPLSSSVENGLVTGAIFKFARSRDLKKLLSSSRPCRGRISAKRLTLDRNRHHCAA